MLVHESQRETAATSPVDEATLLLRIRTPNESEQEVGLTGAKWTIGSGPRCNVRIQGQGVHPLHCLISREAEGLVVRRWSPNTLLNGSSFTASPLVVGDCLQLGSIEAEVVDADGASAPPTAQRSEAEVEEAVPATSAPPQAIEQPREPVSKKRKPVSTPTVKAPVPVKSEPQRQIPQPAPNSVEAGMAGRGRQEIIAAAEAVFQQLRSANSIARGRGRKLVAAMRHERSTHRKLQGRLQSLEQRTGEALREIESLSGRCATLSHERDTLADRLAASQQNLAEFQKKRDEKQQACEDLEAQLAEWQNQYAALQEDLNTSRAELEDRQKYLEQERARWDEERELLESGLRDIQADQEAREVHWHQQLECAQQELNLSRDDVKALKDRLQEERSSWKAELKTFEEKLSEAEAQRGDLEVERSEWEQLVASLHEELDHGRAEVERYERQLQDERTSSTEQRKAIQSQIAELQSDRDRLEVERVKWEKSVQSLQKEVTKARSEAESYEERFQIEQAAWDKDRETLRTQIRDIQAERDALDAQRQEWEHRISILQQEVNEFRQNTQAIEQSTSAERTAWEQERHTLRESFSEIQDERNSLEAQQDEWHRRQAELESRLADWEKKVADLERDLEVQSEEEHRNTEAFEAEKAKWQQERKELEAELQKHEEAKKAAATHARKSGSAEKEKQRLTDELSRLTSEKDGLAGDLENVQQQLRDLQSQLNGQGSEAQSLAHRLEKLNEERETLVQERDQFAKERDVLKADLAEVRDTLAAQRTEWQERQSAFETELAEAKSTAQEVARTAVSAATVSPATETETRPLPQEVPTQKSEAVRFNAPPQPASQRPASPSYGQSTAESQSSSFIERYSHLFDEDEQQSGPAPAPTQAAQPTFPQASPIAPSQPQAAPAGDDSSVEEYMSKLMLRLRGESAPAVVSAASNVTSSESAGTNTAFSSTRTPDGSDTSSAPAVGEEGIELADDDSQYLRRSSTPARSADMSALRALANSSARQHIATKVSKEKGHHASVNLFMAVVAIGSGGYLVSTAPEILNFQFIAGFASLSTAIYWGFLSLDRLMQAKKIRKVDETKWGADGLPIDKEEIPIT